METEQSMRNSRTGGPACSKRAAGKKDTTKKYQEAEEEELRT